MNAIVIDSIGVKQVNENRLTVSCKIAGVGYGVLEYNIESENALELLDKIQPITPEFAVMACMPTAMLYGYDIVSRIPIDPVFLSNIRLYVKRMKAYSPETPPLGWELYKYGVIDPWKDSLYDVKIQAEENPMLGSVQKTRVGMMGSGGVDSLYTLMGVHEIDDVVIIKNMNYPNVVNSINVFKTLRPELRIHVVEVPEFNYNQSDTWEWLTFCHAPFLASAALLFSKYFTSMLISGTDRGKGVEIGSGWDVDYLWSSSHMRFLSYGNVSRFRKIEYLGNHEKADLILKNIHLCSDSKQREDKINCSNCWKCLFSMLIIDSLGFRDKATAFDFTDFVENFKNNFIKWCYNADYTFLYDMPLIMGAYENRGEKAMLDLCKDYMNDKGWRIPYRLTNASADGGVGNK